MSEEHVLRGPKIEIPDCSVAEYFLPKLKLIRDEVILVNGETGESYTGWEYLSKSLQLLEGLKGLGVQSKDVVALLARNSFEANEVMLGCWLGSIPVAPINGLMKPVELQHSFNLIKPKVIFCEEVMVENVAAALEVLSTTPIVVITNASEDSKYTYIKFNDLKEDIGDPDDFVPEPIESPRDQLIVIPPSSGTSGFPKAIGLTHRSMIYQNLLLEKMNFLENRDCFVQISHFFWVTGILAFIRGLTMGAKRVFVKNHLPRVILKTLQDNRANSTMMTPVTYLGLSKFPGFHDYDLSHLNGVFLGGSPLTATILKGIKQENPNLKIYQVYGLTESSGPITYNDEEDLSVGKLVYGVELKIVDLKTGKSLGTNQSGEICVKCPGMMKAYVGSEELTGQSIDADGWLHTGDIGYYDDAEKVYIIDRLKEMIKVRGMQVAPPEVENVIAQVPGVVEVAVVGIPNEINESYLSALVVRHKSMEVTEKDIHSAVEASLSQYKQLTGGVHFIESIPKTDTGKINRNLLRSMAQKLYSESKQ